MEKTTVHSLTDQEFESEMEKTARAAFDAGIAAKLGPKAQPSDFIDDRDSDTPHHEVYLDSSAGEEQ